MVTLAATSSEKPNCSDFVIPAQAGTQRALMTDFAIDWVPACAGMTVSGESRNLIRLHKIDSYKSIQSGFISSINLSFHARFHFLRRFSRIIADSMSSCSSK